MPNLNNVEPKFSTLNDRGLPLSDADIFKAQFYKYYSDNGKKDEFIKRWKNLEDICNKAFSNSKNEPMDEVFTRYMYFKRAQNKVKLSTTEGLREFFEKDSYSLLKNDECLSELEVLADFWNSVASQDRDRFSVVVLKKLFVLNYAPNEMWTYFVSVYFLTYRDEFNRLDNIKFFLFLDKTIAFIWAYALTNPGVNALRIPIYSEMINIIKLVFLILNLMRSILEMFSIILILTINDQLLNLCLHGGFLFNDKIYQS